MSEELLMGGVTLLTLGMTYIITVGTAYLKAKMKDLMKQDVLKDREILKIGISAAEKAIEVTSKAVVGKLEQLCGEQLREKVKQGLSSKEELFELANTAYQEVIKDVTPEMLSLMNGCVTDVEKYVRDEIERQVVLLKSEKVSKA